ncbi:Cell division protein FtsL [Thiomonas sp. X19]|uniref:cell division protein FtsL n=1 Tax=Thiomonas sp. X19 TaxID=1050370 RepID=UPI000B72DB82|nr:cell division protein FtsL [Thiomonas sp. X19]SCC92230.1 Cell division protein FtsL [Thiomonas sp. X19]
MTRLNLLLLLIAMASAMLVVRAQYEARRTFAALDAAQQRAMQLQLDHDRLQVEVRALSVPGRIEELARNTLGLVPVTPARTDYISAARLPSLPASIPTR